MSHARKHAMALGHFYIAPGHVLLGLMDADGLVKQRCAALHSVRPAIQHALGPRETRNPPSQLPFTGSGKRALMFALMTAEGAPLGAITTLHLLAGLAASKDAAVGVALSGARLELGAIHEQLGNLTENDVRSVEGFSAPARQLDPMTIRRIVRHQHTTGRLVAIALAMLGVGVVVGLLIRQ